MKKYISNPYLFYILLSLVVIVCSSQRSFSQCVNADFSNGTLSGWTGTWGFGTFCVTQPAPNPYQNAGLNQGANNQAPNNNTPQKNHFIMTGGMDPVLSPYGYSLPMVYPGNTYSGRIGNTHADGDGESISYSFLVTNNSCNFTYHYAVVLEEATDLSHANAGTQPYFNIKMVDGSSNPIACAAYEVDGNTAPTIGGFTNIPAATTGSDPILFKPWTSVFIPLNAYIGQTVTITFTTRSCFPCIGICCGGSHYAYAYLSAECSSLQVVSSSAAICGGQTVTLTGPVGAATYSWTGPGIVAPTDSQKVVINQPGHYTLTMTTLSDNPCTFTLDTTIAASAVSVYANFSATTVCVGSPTVFTDLSTPVGQISAWAWDFLNTGTTNSTTESPSYIFSAPGTYPVKLTVTNSPCTADTVINVAVGATATATFTASGPVCTGQTSNIVYTGSGTAIDTFNWNFGGGTVVSGSGMGPYTVSWATPGTKSITLSVVSVAGCGITQTTNSVIVTPGASLSLNPDTTICTGSSAILTATPTVTGGTYLWTPGGATTNSITVSPVSDSTFTVTYTMSGCPPYVDSTRVIIDPAFSVALTPTTTSCGASITSSVTPSGSYSYLWSNNVTTPNDSNISGGSYTLTVIDQHRCTATATAVVNAPAVATLGILPSDTTVLAGNPVQLNSIFGGYPVSSITSYSWTPSTGLSCISCPNPIVSTSSLTDSFNLYTLTVMYNGGCSVTALDTIKIEYETGVAIPTAFTPNADGKNDVYMVLASGVKSFYMTIYNRWGERVYESTDITQGWDGTYGGKPQPSEDYSAFIQIGFVNGKTLNKTVTVSLFR